MFSIESCPLPDEALLRKYLDQGAYTDCYRIDADAIVTQAQFIDAFYTTLVFRLERIILKWAAARPSLDSEARQLADGDIDSFAAWHVEGRSENQLLLCDFHGRTRSWLMTLPLNGEGRAWTRLYFGSAVVPRADAGPGNSDLGPIFNALLGFHRIYSRVLLQSAKSRLMRQIQRDASRT